MSWKMPSDAQNILHVEVTFVANQWHINKKQLRAQFSIQAIQNILQLKLRDRVKTHFQITHRPFKGKERGG